MKLVLAFLCGGMVGLVAGFVIGHYHGFCAAYDHWKKWRK